MNDYPFLGVVSCQVHLIKQNEMFEIENSMTLFMCVLHSEVER